MYFILYLVKVTQTIHIITITLLHIVYLVTKALLLPSPLLHLSHGHILYIAGPSYNGHCDGSCKGLNLGSHVFSSADSE
jgi:hypothetical protein